MEPSENRLTPGPASAGPLATPARPAAPASTWHDVPVPVKMAIASLAGGATSVSALLPMPWNIVATGIAGALTSLALYLGMQTGSARAAGGVP